MNFYSIEIVMPLQPINDNEFSYNINMYSMDKLIV